MQLSLLHEPTVESGVMQPNLQAWHMRFEPCSHDQSLYSNVYLSNKRQKKYTASQTLRKKESIEHWSKWLGASCSLICCLQLQRGNEGAWIARLGIVGPNLCDSRALREPHVMSHFRQCSFVVGTSSLAPPYDVREQEATCSGWFTGIQ